MKRRRTRSLGAPDIGAPSLVPVLIIGGVSVMGIALYAIFRKKEAKPAEPAAGEKGAFEQSLIWPIGMGVYRITSKFGARTNPITGAAENHPGLDLAAPAGTPVRAAADGIVSRAYVSDSYGNRVILVHPGKMITTYNHLSQINVLEGQMVDQGDIVGLVGSTGMSTGPHLHFEVKDGTGPLNPSLYLPPVNVA